MWWPKIKLALVILSTAIGVGLAVVAWPTGSDEHRLTLLTDSSWTGSLSVSPQCFCFGISSFPPGQSTMTRMGGWGFNSLKIRLDAMPSASLQNLRQIGFILADHKVSDLGLHVIWGNISAKSPAAYRVVWFPTAYAIVLALVPIVVGTTQAMKPRAPSGGCQTCGYDLRATPDRCPECGSTPALAETQGASTAGR